jgi:hypothetical protein
VAVEVVVWLLDVVEFPAGAGILSDLKLLIS